MKTLLSILCLFLASCELPTTYYAKSVDGNVVYEHRYGQLGGTRSIHRADGSSEVNDYQTSFRDGANAVGVGLTAHYGFLGKQSDNTLSTVKVHSNTKGTVLTGSDSSQTVVFPPQQ